MTIEANINKIVCKICGSEVDLHKYHRHVMALHTD